MKILCSKNDLNYGVQVVQKAIAKQNVIPLLTGILIEAKKDKIYLFAKNMEMSIECVIPANVEIEGSVVIDARYFAEIVRKLPEADVIITVKENKAQIDCAQSSFKLNIMDVQEYPKQTLLSADNPIKISQGIFKNMIKQTIFAVSTNEEVRQYLTGVNFIIQDAQAILVATDGHRLAIRSTTINDYTGKQINIIIPGKTLNELLKILSDDDSILRISVFERQIVFEFDTITLVSQLLEGDYINYKNVFPKDFSTIIRINTKDFLDAIERASLLAKADYNKVIISLKESKLVVNSQNSEVGQLHEEIPVKAEGNELRIAFNSQYLIDVLKIIDSQEVLLKMINDRSPCLIKPNDYDGYKCIVMPVRIS